MTHLPAPTKRVPVLVLFLVLTAGMLTGTPAVSAAPAGATSAGADAQASAVFLATFESGRRGWTTGARTRLRTVAKGHRSARAARLAARVGARAAGRAGSLAARTRVSAVGARGSTHVVTAWVRAPRRAVRTSLVVREVEPATGEVIQPARRDRVRARGAWRRAKVTVVRSSDTSVFTVAVRTASRAHHVLLDDVRVRPTTAPAPTPTPTPTPSGAFPGAGNTGVPEGVALAPYAGPMTVTAAGTVIDAKQITGRLVVRAPNVVVTRSQVNGTVYIERSGSLTMSDSTVDGGTSQDSAVSQSNFTLRRVEIVGARASVGCDGSCEVEDSWLHGQYMPAGSDWHGDGFLSNGGSNMVLRHNTLACDSKPTGNGGACSAAVALYGDFAPIRDVTVEGNLFVSSPAGYCLYGGYDPGKPFGGQASNVRVTGNVFARGSSGKCAVYGAAAAVAGGGSNVFTGNLWDDGKPVRTS
ncbi:hypothetical protein [Nocardioides houyundeii]|uniref:hypothetical protein n=1 Tax=Nocardioides houyundeii TaxID=2045452 RepID=UPI0013B39A80|nr:hypothetical protein [Nocardioides houyundeii]